MDDLRNKIALEVLEVLAQAKYGVSYILLDKQQQKHLVVDAGDSCKNLLALLQAEVLKARKEENAKYMIKSCWYYPASPDEPYIPVVQVKERLAELEAQANKQEEVS